MWRRSGDTGEPELTVEMTATNDGTLGIDQENPIIAVARQSKGVNFQDDAAQRRAAAEAVELEWERQFGSFGGRELMAGVEQGDSGSLHRSQTSVPTIMRGAEEPHDFGGLGSTIRAGPHFPLSSPARLH